VPTNQQRREAAKRKLERQLVRREERERGRRQRLVIAGVVATVLVIAGGVWYATSRGNTPATASSGTGSTGTAAATSTAPKTPCTYPKSGKAEKQAKAPTNLSPANTATVNADLTLNGQKVELALDRAAAPCTVNSFLSLASQGFYNSTPCSRLTGNSALYILQCGDPTGVGNGGPGYTFADELSKTKTYPKGTLAMANSGPDTNGSQFFITYKDSQLSPAYTVFGKVSDAGLAVIADIAAKGIKGNSQDGAPVAEAKINSVTVPGDAVTATGSYASSAPAAVGTAPGSNAPASGSAQPSGSAPASGSSLPSSAPASTNN